jgi:hypothetical protein
MLGGAGGRGCIEDSLDGPDHFAILSCGSEIELLIGWTLEGDLSFTDAMEPISLCIFKDACDRCFFWANACTDNDSNVQLPGGKEIWTKLGGFGFRKLDLMVLLDDLLWKGGDDCWMVIEGRQSALSKNDEQNFQGKVIFV